MPSDVQLFVENGGGERGGEHGAERGEHGGVERAPHGDAPRLQVEHHARPEHALHSVDLTTSVSVSQEVRSISSSDCVVSETKWH